MGDPPNDPPPPSTPPPSGPPPAWGAPPAYGAPPQWSPPPSWGYAATQPPTSGPDTTEPFAIVSLVASLVGVFVCFIGPVAAIVFGHIARSRIKRSGAKGAGLALAGLIIGYIEVVVGVAGIAVLIVIGIHSNSDASGTSHTLAQQIRIVAERTGSSPRSGEVVSTAIREAGIPDNKVYVGSTSERAVDATTNDLAAAHWQLEVHQGSFGKSCVYLPPAAVDYFQISRGTCFVYP
ncbi:MAG TPA: DUF4190 domain-containing protein [Acidimicrobiia bacterium]